MEIPKAIEDMAWALEEALRGDCWDVEVTGFEDADDTCYGCLCLNGLTERGVFGVFSRLELYVCPLEGSSDRAGLTFVFFADPGAVARIIGPDKRALGRAVKRDDFRTFRSFSSALIGKAGLEAGGCAAEMRCPGSYTTFKTGRATAAYEVEVEFRDVRKAGAAS